MSITHSQGLGIDPRGRVNNVCISLMLKPLLRYQEVWREVWTRWLATVKFTTAAGSVRPVQRIGGETAFGTQVAACTDSGFLFQERSDLSAAAIVTLQRTAEKNSRC